MENLQDKVAVITGGASGIGRAVAERAAAEGMKIVLGRHRGGPAEGGRGRADRPRAPRRSAW